MLVNPYKHREVLQTYPGNRMLQETFGILGVTIPDPFEGPRTWTLQALYAPVEERAVGGIRAKVEDQKGVTAFINQMDLEVLLGMGKPGQLCLWSDRRYAEPGESDFYGMTVDTDDLLDDLHGRELLLRARNPYGYLEGNLDITRFIHVDEGRDFEEYFVLLWDGDPQTGISPDLRLETLEYRWSRVERTRVRWESIGT